MRAMKSASGIYRVGLTVLCCALLGCNASESLNTNAQSNQQLSATFVSILKEATQSYRLGPRGALEPAHLLSPPLQGERVPVDVAFANQNLDLFRAAGQTFIVPDGVLHDVAGVTHAAPWLQVNCPTHVLQAPGSRLVRAGVQPLAFVDVAESFVIGVLPDGRMGAASFPCIGALHPQRREPLPFVYAQPQRTEGFQGELAPVVELVDTVSRQRKPLYSDTRIEPSWPICLKRIVAFMQWYSWHFALGEDQTKPASPEETLVCAEKDDPRLFIAPPAVYARFVTAWDPENDRALNAEERNALWAEGQEVRVDFTLEWKNLGSHWIALKGDPSVLKYLPIRDLELHGDNFFAPAGISLDWDDFAWIHPAGYPAAPKIETGQQVETSYSSVHRVRLTTNKPPAYIPIVLQAQANTHPHTLEGPVYPGQTNRLIWKFRFDDYGSYAVDTNPHLGTVQTSIDINTDFTQ